MSYARDPQRAGARGWRVALALVLLAAVAYAQPLRDLLPVDAVLVLGIEGGAAVADQLTPLRHPWQTLGVGDALLGLFGVGLSDTLDDAGVGVRGALAQVIELGPQALLGEAAYLVVSVNPFNPLPALTLLARIDEITGARVDALLHQALADGARAQREGSINFVLVGPEVLGWPFAAVRDGDFLGLSSDPDALRTVLRQRQGSSEPNLLQTPGARSTLAHLGDGVLLAYLDPGGLARAITPIASRLGFDRSVQRLLQAARSSGPLAGVARFENHAIVTRSLQRIDDERGDRALQALLTHTPVALTGALRYLPENARSVSLQPTDLQALWSYLTLLARELPELGVPDLPRTIRDIFGVNVADNLINWTAAGLVSVQTLPPDESWLGGQVIGLRTRDEAAARRGVQALTLELAAPLMLFTNPFSQGSSPASREYRVAGVSVRATELIRGVTVVTAVHDGWVWLASSEAALAQVLRAGLEGDGSATPLARALTRAPSDAHAVSASRAGLALSSTVALLLEGGPLLASTLLGANFDAASSATAERALQAYLDAITPLFGEGLGWSRLDREGRVERVSVSELKLP